MVKAKATHEAHPDPSCVDRARRRQRANDSWRRLPAGIQQNPGQQLGPLKAGSMSDIQSEGCHDASLGWESAIREGARAEVHLPGNFELRSHVHSSGRRTIEIYDPSGDLVGFVASTSLEIVSVDAAWRGLAIGPHGEGFWWALAMGHTVGGSSPSVTFTRRLAQGRERRLAVATGAVDGLWVATASGLHTTVSLRHGSRHVARRLIPTTWPTTATASA